VTEDWSNETKQSTTLIKNNNLQSFICVEKTQLFCTTQSSAAWNIHLQVSSTVWFW